MSNTQYDAPLRNRIKDQIAKLSEYAGLMRSKAEANDHPVGKKVLETSYKGANKHLQQLQKTLDDTPERTFFTVGYTYRGSAGSGIILADDLERAEATAASFAEDWPGFELGEVAPICSMIRLLRGGLTPVTGSHPPLLNYDETLARRDAIREGYDPEGPWPPAVRTRGEDISNRILGAFRLS